jgi:hypothetical protein
MRALFGLVGFLFALAWVAFYCTIVGGIIYVAAHFIRKVW